MRTKRIRIQARTNTALYVPSGRTVWNFDIADDDDFSRTLSARVRTLCYGMETGEIAALIISDTSAETVDDSRRDIERCECGASAFELCIEPGETLAAHCTACGSVRIIPLSDWIE